MELTIQEYSTLLTHTYIQSNDALSTKFQNNKGPVCLFVMTDDKYSMRSNYKNILFYKKGNLLIGAG